MSLLSEAKEKLDSFATEITDRAQSLLHDISPVVNDGATALENFSKSKIVTELAQYGEDILPESTVNAIVGLIHDAGEAAAKIASLTAPPSAEEAPASAQPQ